MEYKSATTEKCQSRRDDERSQNMVMKKGYKVYSAKVLLAFIMTAMMALCWVTDAFAERSTIRISVLKGPTGIGMCHLMEEKNDYVFTLCGSADEAVAAIASGSVDIAAIPTNLASILYKKTNGRIRLLALNTLGVLYILENGDTVHQVSDLAGKTLYATGQAAVPEYTMNYILKKNGLENKTRVEYSGEHAELAALAASGERDLVLLPEPFVTSLMIKNSDFRIALDVTELFAEASAGESVLSMGCIVAREEFVKAYPDQVEAFLAAYEASVNMTNNDPEEAGRLAEVYGVMPSAAVVTRAIPNCHIVMIHGDEMKAQIVPFFEILKTSEPASIGGELPGDDFYYGCE